MFIGGYQPLSLLDYPERLAAVIFTQGCNLACPYCHNPQLLTKSVSVSEKVMDDKAVLLDLKNNQALIEAVVITGGEPTIQDDLCTFIRQLKQLGLLVKLDTNGTRPDVLRSLLKQKLLDFIAMDFKSLTSAYPRYCHASSDDAYAVEESIDLIINSDCKHHFRTTLVEGDLTEEELLKMACRLSGADHYLLQSFRPARVLNKTYSVKQPFSIHKLKILEEKMNSFVKTNLV